MVDETDVTPDRTGPQPDGRTSRSARTRATVVDALLALLDGGNLRPTGREIADEAGVSLRSVYVHFDDVESLFCEAAARHHEQMEKLYALPVPLTGTLDDRVHALVDRHRAIYEEGAQVRRAALLQEPFSPVLRRVIDKGRRALAAEIEGVFSAELGMVTPGERPRLQAALEIATSPGTWDALRAQHELSPDGAAVLVCDMVRATLAGWGVDDTTDTTDTADTTHGDGAPGDPSPPTAGPS